MRRSVIIGVTVIASIVLTAGIVYAAGTHNVTSQFGPAGDIYQVDGTMKMRSVMIGEQGVGGVTYFNGSIVNDTTANNVDNPVTFGDNVRIDGRVWRGATAGTSDAQPFIVNDNMELTGTLAIGDTLTTLDVVPPTDNVYSLGTSTMRYKDIYASGAVTIDGSLVGTDIIETGHITDGTIATADIADGAVTSAKINNGTIATADIADDAVDEDKISGAGGANLPIAYGACKDDGTLYTGTSNVSCSWDAGNGWYEITITGENYFYQDYVTLVTSKSSNYIPDTGSVNDKLLVDFEDDAGNTGLQTHFSFVVFKP